VCNTLTQIRWYHKPAFPCKIRKVEWEGNPLTQYKSQLKFIILTDIFHGFRVKRGIYLGIGHGCFYSSLRFSVLIIWLWNKSNFYARNKSVKFVSWKIWWPHCMSLGISLAFVFTDQGKPRKNIVQVVSFMNDVVFRRNWRQPSSIRYHEPIPTVHEQTILTVSIRQNYNAINDLGEKKSDISVLCDCIQHLRPRGEWTEQQFLESRMSSVTGSHPHTDNISLDPPV
jgi:hypothetical protein